MKKEGEEHTKFEFMSAYLALHMVHILLKALTYIFSPYFSSSLLPAFKMPGSPEKLLPSSHIQRHNFPAKALEARKKKTQQATKK
ncbi:CLUMA_CG020458, isoform A [Clunio marinus]|uniref:CLUMA_CG020458, isoform A n=1 Tax=Clunio marinus TaxID=568069 RepID=A0A1J1J921_9DIPT|nr:CLUMA_CG020458, isoform A [Clunio marinus]